MSIRIFASLNAALGSTRLRSLFRFAAGASILGLAAGTALADPRTPISSIPFTITQSGSYYLTANLTSPGIPAGGITINASHVTLDLMGFVLSGPRPSAIGSASPGILVSAPNSNVAIHSGTIRAWGGPGVDAASASVMLEDLRVVDNRSDGIRAGDESTVRGCTATGNTGTGILVGEASTVLQSVASRNGGHGIDADVGSTIDMNTTAHNAWNGIVGGNGSSLNGNTATHNAMAGLRAIGNNTITANTVDFNTLGISCGGACVVLGNGVSVNSQTGLSSDFLASGYASNVFQSNFENVSSSGPGNAQIGGNLCNENPCP